MPSKKEKLVYTQTEEEYQKGLAKGWTDEDMLRPGTYNVRRSPWAAKLKDSNKVKVSIYLDKTVVEYFRDRAKEPNAAPYQTQINNELRRVMENGSPNVTSVELDILNNNQFLKALKKKLETV